MQYFFSVIFSICKHFGVFVLIINYAKMVMKCEKLTAVHIIITIDFLNKKIKKL